MAAALEKEVKNMPVEEQRTTLLEIKDEMTKKSKKKPIVRLAEKCCTIVNDDEVWPELIKPKTRYAISSLQRRAALAVCKTLNLSVEAYTKEIDPTPERSERDGIQMMARITCNGQCQRTNSEEAEENPKEIKAVNTQEHAIHCKHCLRISIREDREGKRSKKCPSCEMERPTGEPKSELPCQICAMMYLLRKRGIEERE
jgi:hypothetical protein